jgi:cell wall-associated NlpC family hydrolase
MLSNRRIARGGAALVAFLALAAAPYPASAGGVYFVKEGDTLSRIARVFGVAVDDIRAANPLAGDRIAPGDRLRIPDAATSPAAKTPPSAEATAPRHDVDPGRVRQALCREETVYHAVAKGETLTAIARRYRTSVDELRHLNKLSARARLSIGQRILVRRSGPRTHVVGRGETLRRIAERYRLSVAQIKLLNGLDSDALVAGQRLTIEPCDPLAAAGSMPPPLAGSAAGDDFLASVAEASAQASREARAVLGAGDVQPAAAGAVTPLSRQVIDLAKTMLNIPYRFGGTTLRGIDCSAFVQRVFGLIDLELPRTAREQFGLGERIDRGALSVGDLVFFRTYASFPSHVGIYLGDDRFIHASSVDRKVTIDSLEQGYYRKRFLGGRRVIDERGPSLAAAP